MVVENKGGMWRTRITFDISAMARMVAGSTHHAIAGQFEFVGRVWSGTCGMRLISMAHGIAERHQP